MPRGLLFYKLKIDIWIVMEMYAESTLKFRIRQNVHWKIKNVTFVKLIHSPIPPFINFSAVNILYLVFWALNNIIQVFVMHQLGLLTYLTVSYLIFLAYFLLDFKLRLLEIEILCVVWNISDVLQVGMHNITFAPQDDLLFRDAERFGEVEDETI